MMRPHHKYVHFPDFSYEVPSNHDMALRRKRPRSEGRYVPLTRDADKSLHAPPPHTTVFHMWNSRSEWRVFLPLCHGKREFILSVNAEPLGGNPTLFRILTLPPSWEFQYTWFLTNDPDLWELMAYDYDAMRTAMAPLRLDLLRYVMRPSQIARLPGIGLLSP